MNTPQVASNPADTEVWTNAWLSSVADGTYTMSQRKLTSVESRGGGLEALRRAAEARCLHLLLLQDDKGNTLVAASAWPFTVIC